MKLDRYARFAWGVLLLNLLVVMWGAFVRATGSGAGCGSHWPLCNGEVVPRAESVETIIEFTHRLTSGLSLLLIVVLFIWGWRRYAKGHPVRYAALASLVFIVVESLLGAGLVLFGWVADDDSIARAIVMMLHLANTLLLLASITLAAWWASGGDVIKLETSRTLVWLLRIGLVATIVVGMSGAIAALGDTLYPANTLREGLRQDFSATAHVLVRLRVFHPLIAIGSGVLLLLIGRLLRLQPLDPRASRLIRMMEVLVVVQLAAGFVNVALLAPVWMQLLHLLLADLVWIALILVSASARAVPVPRRVEAVAAQA